jgi:hypothetical protein
MIVFTPLRARGRPLFRGDGRRTASPTVSISPFPVSDRPDLDPLELYASAIDTSDYVSRVAPQVRRLAPDIGKLLDVGAGGGQLGASLQDRALPWTAIEPSPTMRARLARLHVPPHIVASRWDEAWIARQSHDSVLAATMPAFFDHTEAFLARCREGWCRRMPARAACASPAACRALGIARTRRRASISC